MKYTVALAGTPNSGKTTIFNQLAGAREKVGNWPGTTVERKEGVFTCGTQVLRLVDLPGTYSISAYSLDERIACDFLINEKPDVVVAIIDAAHLDRNLYLVVQLLEMGQNVIVCLNMMDIVRKRGMSIDANAIAAALQAPVVETAAVRGEGIPALKGAIASSAKRIPGALHIDYHELEGSVAELANTLAAKNIDIGLPLRPVAIKMLERNPDISGRIKETSHFRDIDTILQKIIAAFPEDPEAFIIERRYAYLKGLVKECVHRHLTVEERVTISDKIDRVVTHPFLGIPIFLGFMYALFSLVFAIGEPLVELISDAFSRLAQSVAHLFAEAPLPAWIGSLVTDGVIAGVGSVLSFLPYILLLFIGITVLEHGGYLARAAFVMDRMMHALGLHGKSFIPMLIGFGCNIPGVMAARTLESEKDRILTILVVPLMSCSARLPVYTLFAAAFFPHQAGLVVFSLYLLGIVLAVIVARVFRKIFFKGETTPLIIELPPYRIPNIGHMFEHMWRMAWLFVKKAGTVIFAAVMLMWLLASIPFGVEYASEGSIIGVIGRGIAPIFEPAGFGFWQAAVALVSGIVAKEVVVGTLATLYGVQDASIGAVLQQHFTPLSAYVFLVMTLIYIPCIPAIAVIKQETNWKWAGVAVCYTLVLGWVVSVLVYQAGRFFI